MSAHEIVSYVIDALGEGSLYALFALSISIVFGVMKLVNFAQGSLVAAGAYALAVVSAPFAVRVGAVVAVSVMLALVMERVAFRPLRNAEGDTLLVASFAVSVLVENAILLIFGSIGRGTPLPSYFTKQLSIGSISFPLLDPIAIGITGAILVALVLFLNRTATGLSIRAAADDFTMARLLQVPANRVIAVAFGLSGLLAAPAVLVLMGTVGIATSTVGDTPVLGAFAAVIIGGMGSLPGAVLGGYLFGFLTVLFQAVLPGSLSSFQSAFVFGVVLLVLAIRPQGLVRSPALQKRV
jgi:branched-chain amino acid transport system permease protein